MLKGRSEDGTVTGKVHNILNAVQTFWILFPLFPLSSALLAVVTNSGRINANDYFQKGIALIIWEVIMSGKWFGLRINE